MEFAVTLLKHGRVILQKYFELYVNNDNEYTHLWFATLILNLDKNEFVESPIVYTIYGLTGGFFLNQIFKLITPYRLKPYVAPGVFSLALLQFTYRRVKKNYINKKKPNMVIDVNDGKNNIYNNVLF